jgi:hypothetical protein
MKYAIFGVAALVAAGLTIATPPASADAPFTAHASTASAAHAASTTAETIAYRYHGFHNRSSHGVGVLAGELSREGLRPVSLSVGQEAGRERFAGFWDNRPDPEFDVRSWMHPTQYQQQFDELTAKGYQPTLVTATTFQGGPGDVFAAVFEKKDEMRAKGLYPASVDMENGVYAAVFTPR